MDYFYSIQGGTEGQLYALIENLDRDYFDPTLCLFRDKNNFIGNISFPCNVFILDIKSFLSFHTYLMLIKLRRYIKKKGFDIVQTLFNDASLSVPLMSIGLKSKMVSTRRDMGFWYTPLNLMILRPKLSDSAL